jgi:hypothetical protein
MAAAANACASGQALLAIWEAAAGLADFQGAFVPSRYFSRQYMAGAGFFYLI